MRVGKVLLTLAVAAAALAAALPSEAARFQASFGGQFTALDPLGQQFAPPNLVRGFAIYDDAALVGGVTTGAGLFQRVDAGAGSTFRLDLTIGSQRFFEFQDLDFASGLFPEFYFLDGVFAGFDFVADPALTGGFEFESFAANYLLTFANTAANPFTGRLFFEGRDPLGGFAQGFFRFPARNVVPVDDNDNPIPEPGTMILLGSGLMGLAGYGRKRKG